MKSVSKNLKLATPLCELIESRAKELGTDASKLYEALYTLVTEFRERNNILLVKRQAIQNEVDRWFESKLRQPVETEEFISFLKDYDFIAESSCTTPIVETKDLPAEIGEIPAPQLVVPADKANMVLNALNARYVNLEDALYVSNLIEGEDKEARKIAAIKRRNKFLQLN